MMNREEFVTALLRAAEGMGCPEAEVFCAESKALSVNALEGEIDRYSVSRTAGVSVRISMNGRNGYAYTEALEEPEQLVMRAMDNAKSLETEEPHPMQTAKQYCEVQRPASPLDHMKEQEKIDLALEMERSVLAADPRIKRVSGCTVEQSQGRISIKNSLGLKAERPVGTAYCYVSPVAEAEGEMQTGFAFRMGPEAADVEACAREAALDAISRLGGKPVPSGAYSILFKNTAMADLLAAYVPVFSAEEAQKGRSLLAGKEGEMIAAAAVTVTDDPFHPAAPRAFDGEGTPCRTKNIIENGVLTTLLHNLKTARKAGVETTGNARRASAAATVGIGPSVLYIQPGTETLKSMCQTMGDGLLINDLEGLHAGVNQVSGDFSLKASGRRILRGADAGPVSRITVAGNFFDVLKGVLALGEDLRFTVPAGAYVACPSVLVKELQVAGE